MKLGIVAILVVVVLFRSGVDGQNILGTNWVNDLTRNLGALNRNIQENVQQLNQRISESVGSEVAQVRQLTDNLNEGIATGRIQAISGGTIVNGNNIVVSNERETKIVMSGRTSDGKAFVRELSESVVGDTLRHVVKITYPMLNVTRVYGFTIDLKHVDSKPVPIGAST
ncbi:uncharacterized protein LOC143216664 [Lasioglossum baleicum]|uniref:uncharacterized protein LOC143216664 n=1 Tax=Lasioglossum baleicum TaxID=434251 RepID=UPI003FCD28B8